MAGRGMALTRPAWMKHAEEAKVKDEEDKAAAARAAFDATFRDLDQQAAANGGDEPDSDSDGDEASKLANRPVGPVDPSKCTAAGTGVGGGAAGAAASFVVVTKDKDGRRLPHGGAYIRVRVTPGAGVGGLEQEAVVKDHADGTYTATYAVAKRGDYTVSVDCNGQPISGSPFPVFFSGGSVPLGGAMMGMMPASGSMMAPGSYMNMGQQIGGYNMPGMVPGMLGMIPGAMTGATGGAVLPGLGASFGEVCRDYLNGRCARTDCKHNHPPQNQLMAALAAGSTMGGLSQMPMGPSAAAMAAAQSIAAANAYQAAQAAQKQQSRGPEEEPLESGVDNDDPVRTLHVTNLNPVLTADQLRQLFSYCGTVTECKLSDSKSSACVEYSKPEEAKAALALNNLSVGGQRLIVELEKKPSAVKQATGVSSSLNPMALPQLPMMMQQAVVMQQMQFQQALYMQQALATQQAAARAATVKSASEMAAARAAEISRRLKGDGEGEGAGAPGTENQLPPGKASGNARVRSRSRSKSASRSPIRYRRGRRSRSLSPIRYRRRDRRSPSVSRDHYRRHSRERGSHYRGGRDNYPRYSVRRDRERERSSRDHYSSRSSRRSRSRSPVRRRSRTLSRSPRNRRERSTSPKRHGSRKSERRPTTRSPRQSVSPSKDVKRRPSLSSHSLSTSPVRGKGNLSPQKDIKSPSPPKEIVTVGMDEDRENQQGEDHPVNPAEVAAPGSNKLVDSGTGSETVHMAIEHSVINIQASRSEVLKNGEAGEQMQKKFEFGLEAPGFKRSLKKSSKDASLFSDDESDGTEMEVMDDWRDDAKALAKENSKSFERARGIIHKSTKEQVEIGVGLGTGIVREKRTDFNRQNSTVSDVASKQGYDTIDMQLNAQIDTFRGIDKKDRQRTKENNQDQLDIVENKEKTRTSADKQYEVKSVERMRQEKERENGRSPVSKDVGRYTKIRNEIDASMAAEEVVIFGPKPILKEAEVAESKTVSVEMISEEVQSKAGGVKVNLMKDGLEGTASVLELDNKEEDDIEEEETAKHNEVKTSQRDEEGERHERHRKERHRSHRKKHGEEDDELGTGDDGEKNEDGDTRKERRRHKKKHKTDEDTDKGDRKRRKHKHHRKRRSPSLSPELFPSVNSSKSKQGIDDSIEKHKHHQQKRHPSESQELSPSEDQGKGWGPLDDAAARKKNSNRHKRSRREPSKSQSESLSLSD